jgi:hypothetical protein
MADELVDTRIANELTKARDAVAARGELLSPTRLGESYAAFRSHFSPEKLQFGLDLLHARQLSSEVARERLGQLRDISSDAPVRPMRIVKPTRMLSAPTDEQLFNLSEDLMNSAFWSLAMMVVLGANVAVRADVKPSFPSNVSITVDGEFRIIRSNGIPEHATGQFPSRGNPNTIVPQHYEFRVPANPKVASHTTKLRMQPFGVAVNGVVFDPGAAEWWNGDPSSGWQYEPMALAPLYLGIDSSHAHVQPNGAYHYHGIPTALVYALTGGQSKMVIVGWAADGFPIYNNLGHTNPMDASSPLKTLRSSYRVKKGPRPGGPGGMYDGKFLADYEYVAGSGDLDECNGLSGVTPQYPNGIYHYVLTDQWPYIPRMFRGTPDSSFDRGPMAGGGGRRGGGGLGGGGGPPGGFHLIPRFAEDPLNLTDDQRKQIADLEAETKAKLEKILTADQMKTLEQARPPGRGPGGPGGGFGPGGPPGGGGSPGNPPDGQRPGGE